MVLHGGVDSMDCRYCRHFVYDVPGIPDKRVFNNCTWERLQYDYQKRKAYLAKKNEVGSFCIEWVKDV